MAITSEEVAHVAALARLELNPQEVDAMAGQLDRILGYIEKLNKLDTSGVEPTTHALAVYNAFRSDESKESLSQDSALVNGPQHNAEFFIVPKVI